MHVHVPLKTKSMGVSRKDRTKPNKPTKKLFIISVEIEQLLPHGNSSSPQTTLHLPGTVSLQFITSVQSSCEVRTWAWSILYFK